MIEKTCACGCGKMWRSLPSSKWNYASLDCAEGEGVEVIFSSPMSSMNEMTQVSRKIHHMNLKQKKGRKGKSCT